ncbi:hypothetical protein GX586_12170 [bacterium]|nr:hypothetical protein [bacterium]
MARNKVTLADEDGAFSDWIELHNDGFEPVDLSGWHLTDDATDLAKWTFPGTNIAPGGYLLVFASGKDRATPGEELHSNFKLSGDGEYLALVQPDGATVAHGYSPQYPLQADDVSYGIPLLSSPWTNVLVETGAFCRAIVPTNSAMGVKWRGAASFNDTNWPAGTTGAGYDINATEPNYRRLIGTDMQALMYTSNVGCYLRIPFALENKAAVRALVLDMWYDDGFAAYVNAMKIAAANNVDAPQWNSPATGYHDGDAPERFISSNTGMLVTGTNILAIHIMNRDAGSSDALGLPRLSAVCAVPTGTGDPGALSEPTPGGPNSGPPTPVAAPVTFSLEHGYYMWPIDIELSCATTGAAIRYTTDFTEPGESSGILYTSPVHIARTTCIRAAAFLTNGIRSEATTRTYFLIEDVVNQPSDQSANGFPSNWTTMAGYTRTADYEMDQRIVTNALYSPTIRAHFGDIPTLSLVMDMKDVFDTDTGIYSNPQERGDNWERAASIEIFSPRSDRTGVVINCAVSIQGELNRSPSVNKKHSFRFIFKAPYGPGKLVYPLFPGSKATRFDTFILRGMYGDSWVGTGRASYLRDTYAHDAQAAMGHTSPAARFLHLFINGLYWGVYSATERPDASFHSETVAGSRDDWDIIQGNIAIEAELKEGTEDAYEAMMALVPKSGSNTISDADYALLAQYLDLEQFADYMILNIYGQNYDWPRKNWYCAAMRGTNAAGPPAHRFHFYAWDFESTLGSYFQDRTLIGDNYSERVGPAQIYYKLRRHPEFQRLFGDRLHRNFFNNGALTPAANIARWYARMREIEGPMVCESARWGDYRTPGAPYTRNVSWYSEMYQETNGWFPNRTAVVLSQFKSIGLYPNVTAPVFSHPGGAVTSGWRLAMFAPQGTVYYTVDGSDPWLWGSGVASTAIPYSNDVIITGNVRIKARALDGGEWSALNEAVFTVGRPPFRVTELMYHPPVLEDDTNDANDYEFIELCNISNAPATLSGLSFSEGISFAFGAPVIEVPPDGVVVLVRNLAAFASRYDTNGMTIGGEYSGSLANEGERLALVDAVYGDVLRFTYADTWYPEADGQGSSLEIIDPSGPLAGWSKRDGWQPSGAEYGTPGWAVPEPAAAALALAVLPLFTRRYAVPRIAARSRYKQGSKAHHGEEQCI